MRSSPTTIRAVAYGAFRRPLNSTVRRAFAGAKAGAAATQPPAAEVSPPGEGGWVLTSGCARSASSARSRSAPAAAEPTHIAHAVKEPRPGLRSHSPSAPSRRRPHSLFTTDHRSDQRTKDRVQQVFRQPRRSPWICWRNPRKRGCPSLSSSGGPGPCVSRAGPPGTFLTRHAGMPADLSQRANVAYRKPYRGVSGLTRHSRASGGSWGRTGRAPS
jgi:hypothetical protein